MDKSKVNKNIYWSCKHKFDRLLKDLTKNTKISGFLYYENKHWKIKTNLKNSPDMSKSDIDDIQLNTFEYKKLFQSLQNTHPKYIRFNLMKNCKGLYASNIDINGVGTILSKFSDFQCTEECLANYSKDKEKSKNYSIIHSKDNKKYDVKIQLHKKNNTLDPYNLSGKNPKKNIQEKINSLKTEVYDKYDTLLKSVEDNAPMILFLTEKKNEEINKLVSNYHKHNKMPDKPKAILHYKGKDYFSIDELNNIGRVDEKGGLLSGKGVAECIKLLNQLYDKGKITRKVYIDNYFSVCDNKFIVDEGDGCFNKKVLRKRAPPTKKVFPLLITYEEFVKLKKYSIDDRYTFKLVQNKKPMINCVINKKIINKDTIEKLLSNVHKKGLNLVLDKDSIHIENYLRGRKNKNENTRYNEQYYFRKDKSNRFFVYEGDKLVYKFINRKISR